MAAYSAEGDFNDVEDSAVGCPEEVNLRDKMYYTRNEEA